MKARREVHGLVSSPFIGLWLIYFGPFSGNPRHGSGWCPLSWTVLIKLASNWFKNCGSGLILAQWGTIRELLLIHPPLRPRQTLIYFVFLRIHLFWVSMQYINSKTSGVVATLPILKGKTKETKQNNHALCDHPGRRETEATHLVMICHFLSDQSFGFTHNQYI